VKDIILLLRIAKGIPGTVKAGDFYFPGDTITYCGGLKMHISEGIITGVTAAAYTATALVLTGYGTKKMMDFTKENPEKKTMLGMAGAFIFFLSLIPIPAFTGTCSHPCGTPRVGILLGPWIGITLAGLSLLMQAAFFAHGGFSTWGANVIALGFVGAFFGWGAFKISRKFKLPLVVSAAIGGLVGDIVTYLISGLVLGTVLASGADARFSLSGYLGAIYAAYVPTQLPIAIGEMFLTGWVVSYIYKQRADILDDLKVTTEKIVIILFVAGMLLFPLSGVFASEKADIPAEKKIEETAPGIMGMDEAVNEKYAEEAGKSPRAPYIDIESMGDVWNTVLMAGGCICGFIVGRGWYKYFDKKEA